MISSAAQDEINREKAHGFGPWLSKWPMLIYRFHLGWLLGHRFALITQPVCRSGMLWQTGVLISHDDRHSRTSAQPIGQKTSDGWRKKGPNLWVLSWIRSMSYEARYQCYRSVVGDQNASSFRLPGG
jgi:hypothetical protein